MKKLMMAMILLAAGAASANPSEWLSCTASGDDVVAVSLALASSDESLTVLMEIQNESGESNILSADVAKGALKKQMNQGRIRLQLTSESAQVAQLSLAPDAGGYKGLLQFDGAVSVLVCQPAVK